jgi:hypothetical protein
MLAVQEQLQLQRNRIAALMGQGPDRGLNLTRPQIDLAKPMGLPKSVEANLLGRRPAISDIHQRVGGEIHPKQVKRALEELIERGEVRFEGNKRWRRYWALA